MRKESLSLIKKGGYNNKNISNMFSDTKEPINVITNAVSYFMGKENRFIELERIYNDVGDLVDIVVIPREGYEVLFNYYVKIEDIESIIGYMKDNAIDIIREYKEYDNMCLKKVEKNVFGNKINSPNTPKKSGNNNNLYSTLSAEKTPKIVKIKKNKNNNNNNVRRKLFE